MDVALISSPLSKVHARERLSHTMTVEEILQAHNAPSEFYEFGQVILHTPPKEKRLAGPASVRIIDEFGLDVSQKTRNEYLHSSAGLYDSTPIPRNMWKHVRIKVDAPGVLELCVVQHKSSTILAVVGALAVAALTAFTAGGGLVLLGASASLFGAGTLGAGVASAVVGTLGALALSMLTPPPPSVAQADASTRNEFNASISQNALARFATLPVIFGTIRVAPPLIAKAYTTMENDEIWVHALMGVEGRALAEDILINGSSSGLIERLELQQHDGGPGNAPPTIAYDTVIQQSDQTKIPNFLLELTAGKNDQLLDQVNPDASLPSWIPITADGAGDEYWIRLLFPSGIVSTEVGDEAIVAVRLEGRLKGSATWRRFPTMHFVDTRKGSGPVRSEIKIKWENLNARPGYRISNASMEWPCWELNNLTGEGETYEYESDPYFLNPVASVSDYTGVGTIVPTMTGPTTGICTMSASVASANAYKPCDNDISTFWIAGAAPTQWIKWQFSSAQTVKSFMIYNGATDSEIQKIPVGFYMEGSNDDTNWTVVASPFSQADNVVNLGIYNCDNPGAYTYYRLTITAVNGAADIVIMHLQLYTFHAPGTPLQPEFLSGRYASARQNPSGLSRSYNAELTEDGPIFYLTEPEWPKGQYEFRIQRGWAVQETDFTWTTYSVDGAAAGNFFEYTTSGGKYVIVKGQKAFRSDLVLETFSTVSYDNPVDVQGISWIALRVPNLSVNSVSALYSSYAPVWDIETGVWTEEQQITSNPAALYRALELGYANLKPTPGELIDEPAFIDWYLKCVASGYEVNASAQGSNIGDVKQLLAACGWASVRDTNLVSIAPDYDRSAEEPTQAINDVNSKNLGYTVLLPELPHGIYVEYADETDDFKDKQTIVYRDGYNAENATLFETATYRGFTTLARAEARALFDLGQLTYRKTKYVREMGLEAITLYRGQLVALNSATLDKRMCAGIIKTVTSSGGNYQSVTLDITVDFGEYGEDFVDQKDVTDITEVTTDVAVLRGIAIRLHDGSTLVKRVTSSTSTKVATFQSPFTDDGSIEPGQIAMIGVLDYEYIRAIVQAVQPQDNNTFKVVLVDDASEYLF